MGMALPGRAEEPAGADTLVYLLNIGPGPDIYELEGHAAIAVISPEGDRAYNFGVFDFNAPNFVYRFVKGETDYMAAEMPLSWLLSEYAVAGRTVTAHLLNLSPAETDSVAAALEENVLPQNCTYRYNYIRDNCSTRPLAVIERAVGDTVTFAAIPPYLTEKPTFRNIMRYHHRNYPWYQFGIDIALGNEIDRPVTLHDHAFAPTVLNDMMSGATIAGRPLVKESRVVYEPLKSPVADPTPWYLTPLAASWLLFALALAVTMYDLRRRRRSRAFDAVLFGLYGIAGCVVAYLVFVSVHAATSPNWLIVALNPFCLIVPLFQWAKWARCAVNWYFIINFALVCALVLLWPLTGQSANAAFLPLALADIMRSALRIKIK